MACSMERLSSSGCQHYKRKVKLVSPCCKKMYACRVCHDEKENHILNRRAISEVICLMCDKKQSIQKHCRYCGIIFGKYYCSICHLFDDEEKGQFHCKECGICRVGYRQNYFHCKKCNLCLSLNLQNNHKCLENASRNNCPVCLEDLHSSRDALHIPKCMHIIHVNCKNQLSDNGHNNCLQCEQLLS